MLKYLLRNNMEVKMEKVKDAFSNLMGKLGVVERRI